MASVLVIKAPSEIPVDVKRPIVFLSGPITTPPTWQDLIASRLKESERDVECTILNPMREDWDSSWIEDKTFKPFREQTEWELRGLESADIVVVYLNAQAKAIITLLELGYVLGLGRKVIIGCEKGFWKRGNVDIICGRCGVDIYDTLDEVVERLADTLWIYNDVE